MRQSVLEVDAGQRCRQPAQVAAGCADELAELAEAPVGRRNRLCHAGQHEREPLRILAPRLNPHLTALQRARPRAGGASLHGAVQVGQAQEPLVSRAAEPLGADAADPLATAGVDFVAALGRGGAAGEGIHHGEVSATGPGEPLSPPHPVRKTPALPCLLGSARALAAPSRAGGNSARKLLS